jgi:hypothetical protein
MEMILDVGVAGSLMALALLALNFYLLRKL